MPARDSHAIVRYSTGASRLGTVVVGSTDRGVCSVLFADDADAEDLLRAEFPAVHVARDDATLADDIAAVVALIDGTESESDLTLDLLGTAFQRNVWSELRRIPAGETATYAQIAQRVGRPQAVRAVANACAANHASIVVPCHRVVRTDGGLGGYRWGIDRKRRLLQSERKGS